MRRRPANLHAATIGVAALSLACVFTGTAGAQAVADLASGADVYRESCAACHGHDGRGSPQSAVGFDLPLPDFTDCSFASREPFADWLGIVHDGGPTRAFDRRMPAFGEALSRAQLELAVSHIKGFCADRAWPPGELNLPRALVTEKAYPEDEAVLSTTAASGTFVNEFLYEHRLGSRTQYEVNVPVAMQDDGESWHQGLGDIAVALKHALYHSGRSGTILSAAGELVFPTGKENEGLGGGVTVFEPFVSFGQILPRDSFVQTQTGFEIPFDQDKAGSEFFWRGVVGKTFTQGEFGRAWSPMVEVLGVTELEGDEPALWDLVPQMQVTLSRRQHIMVNVGVRVPINDREDRGTEVLTYFLWDWFDGGLFDGWR